MVPNAAIQVRAVRMPWPKQGQKAELGLKDKGRLIMHITKQDLVQRYIQIRSNGVSRPLGYPRHTYYK